MAVFTVTIKQELKALFNSTAFAQALLDVADTLGLPPGKVNVAATAALVDQATVEVNAVSSLAPTAVPTPPRRKKDDDDSFPVWGIALIIFLVGLAAVVGVGTYYMLRDKVDFFQPRQQVRTQSEGEGPRRVQQLKTGAARCTDARRLGQGAAGTPRRGNGRHGCEQTRCGGRRGGQGWVGWMGGRVGRRAGS